MAKKKVAKKKVTKAAPAEADSSDSDSKVRKNPSVKKTADATLAIYDIVKEKNDATLADIKPKKSTANIYQDGISEEEMLKRVKQLRAAKDAAKKYEGLSDNQLRNILGLVKGHLGIEQS